MTRLGASVLKKRHHNPRSKVKRDLGNNLSRADPNYHDALFQELEGRVSKVYKIGDCAAAGNIQKAVWSANEVAREV